MSLSAGSSPLHSPKITPHTSPAPRRRSHTPNPANYMVPTSASASVANAVSQPPSTGQVIQKETVGGTTYFYTDTTPAPVTGMVCLLSYRSVWNWLITTEIILNSLKLLFFSMTRWPFNCCNCSSKSLKFKDQRIFNVFFIYLCIEFWDIFFFNTAIERKHFTCVSVDTYIMGKHQKFRLWLFFW